MIKTWGFLRSTTDSLGAQAQAVLTAKQHLEDLELDVDTQRKTWAKASEDLKAENADLAQQVKDRQVPPPDYASLSAALQLQLTAARAKVAATYLEADQTLSVWQVQRNSYHQSISDLSHMQEKVQEAMASGNEETLKAKEALEMKQTELAAKTVALKAQVSEQKDANATEAADAGRNETAIAESTEVLVAQFDQQKESLAQVTETAGKAAGLQKQFDSVVHDLALAQEHKLQTTQTCSSKTAELRAVLAAEKEKVALVAAEATKCGALAAQRDFLKSEVAACGVAQPAAA